MGWVDLYLAVPPSCPAVQPLLPNLSQPGQKLSYSGSLEIQVNLTNGPPCISPHIIKTLKIGYPSFATLSRRIRRRLRLLLQRVRLPGLRRGRGRRQEVLPVGPRLRRLLRGRLRRRLPPAAVVGRSFRRLPAPANHTGSHKHGRNESSLMNNTDNGDAVASLFPYELYYKAYRLK